MTIISADEWEMLYDDNGQLIEQGHTLNEGEHASHYYYHLFKTHGLKPIEHKWVNSKGEKHLTDYGTSFKTLEEALAYCD